MAIHKYIKRLELNERWCYSAGLGAAAVKDILNLLPVCWPPKCDCRLVTADSLGGGEIELGQADFPARQTVCLALAGLFPMSAGRSDGSGWQGVAESRH